ncbi:MAG TPA: SPOR domain-containing protein [Bacteroidota bacterium]|nr:SPOR domain-containing protein [Bacteroidota bacterium]
MPDLNLIDEGGIEETPTPSAPMPSKRKGGVGGGSLNKILATVLVLLIVGTALFYQYRKGKFPFAKKKAPVTQVEEQPYTEPEPATGTDMAQQQQAVQQQQPAQQDTTAVSLLETPPVGDASKKTEAKPEGTEQKAEMQTAPMQKLTDMQGNYTVQVSAFREQKQADEIVSRLADGGYPAFVEEIPMKGINWYTVRIGRYASRQDAKKAVSDFALELRSNYWIDKVRSKQ